MSKVSTPKKNATVKNTLSEVKNLSAQPQTSKVTVDPELKTDYNEIMLLHDSIKGIYWAENHLVKSLPKVINSCNSTELQTAITKHWELTKKHVSRLEKIFELLKKDPLAKKSDGMEGLAKEGECIIENTLPGTLSRDLGIIMASQKIEHYEMATYTGIYKLALSQGLNNVAEILNQTLMEEQEADNILSNIAEKLNKKNK